MIKVNNCYKKIKLMQVEEMKNIKLNYDDSDQAKNKRSV